MHGLPGCRGFLFVRVDRGNQFLQDPFGRVIADLAGARGAVAATVIGKTEFTHIGAAAPVEDRFANGKHGVLFFQSPQYVDRNVALGEQRIHHKPIANVDRFFLLEVDNDQILMLCATTF